MIWLWLQEVAFGMRLQGGIVCAGGTGISGPCFLTALAAVALYDFSRLWARKLKLHFRVICHLASAGVLTVLVLADACMDIAAGRQYTMGVTLAFVLALLLYQSPALAVCSDLLLLRGLPPASGDAVPAGQPASVPSVARDQDLGKDLGDVVVPPCCLPFCAFHGRYFLYPRPASEEQKAHQAHRQAEAELEKLHAEQERATQRLLQLEAQLEALQERQREREAKEPKLLEQQLQEQLEESRRAFEQRHTVLREQGDRASKETPGSPQSAAQKESGARPVEPGGDFRSLPPSAYAKVHGMFEQTSASASTGSVEAVAAPKASLVSERKLPKPEVGDFRIMPAAAWTRLYGLFPPGGSSEISEAVQAKPPLSAPVAREVVAGDFRTISPAALSKVHSLFSMHRPDCSAKAVEDLQEEKGGLGDLGKRPAGKANIFTNAPESSGKGDFRALPLDAWEKLHRSFTSEGGDRG